jgi:hypothetical protein
MISNLGDNQELQVIDDAQEFQASAKNRSSIDRSLMGIDRIESQLAELRQIEERETKYEIRLRIKRGSN